MKYTFFEVLAIVVGTERKIRLESGNGWNIYRPGMLKNDNSREWWPTIKEQKTEIWEIKEEPIYVWCVSQPIDGANIISGSLPYKTGGKWETGISTAFESHLFSEDHPQKYKLVLVEE